MSIYLNPNLTIQDIQKLQKLKWEGHAQIQKRFDEALANCKTPEERAMMCKLLFPILMSSLTSAMF